MIERSPTDGIGSLRDRAIRGSALLASVHLLARLISMLRLIVLAAILPPEQLGLYGAAVIVLSLAERLSETGTQQALIQRDGEIQSFLGTGFAVQIVRGLVISIALLVLAPYAERTFGMTGLASLLLGLALVPFVYGLRNISIVLCHRELNFKVVSWIETSAIVVELIVSVSFALIYPVAAALVVGRIVSVVVSVGLSYWLERRHARPEFSKNKFLTLSRFGFWIFVSGILSAVVLRGADLVVARYESAATVAIYHVAYAIACAPLIQIAAVASTALFPALSQLQNERDRIVNAYEQLFVLTAILASGFSAALWLTSAELASLLLSDDYTVVALVIPWLAIWGAGRALESVGNLLFEAIGKPMLVTILNSLTLALLVAVLIPMTKASGVVGAAQALSIVALATLSIRTIMVIIVLGIDPLRQLMMLSGPAIVALVCVLAIETALPSALMEPSWSRLLLISVALLVTFGLGIWVLDRHAKWRVTASVVQTIIPRLKRR